MYYFRFVPYFLILLGYENLVLILMNTLFNGLALPLHFCSLLFNFCSKLSLSSDRSSVIRNSVTYNHINQSTFQKQNHV